jgi:hypothetical protein
MWPLPHSMTGDFRGEPSTASARPARFRFGVEPRERDEVLVEELADGAGGVAAPGAENAQTQPTHLGEHLSAAHEGND